MNFYSEEKKETKLIFLKLSFLNKCIDKKYNDSNYEVSITRKKITKNENISKAFSFLKKCIDDNINEFQQLCIESTTLVKTVFPFKDITTLLFRNKVSNSCFLNLSKLEKKKAKYTRQKNFLLWVTNKFFGSGGF